MSTLLTNCCYVLQLPDLLARLQSPVQDKALQGGVLPACALSLGSMLADDAAQDRRTLSCAVNVLHDLLGHQDPVCQQVGRGCKLVCYHWANECGKALLQERQSGACTLTLVMAVLCANQARSKDWCMLQTICLATWWGPIPCLSTCVWGSAGSSRCHGQSDAQCPSAVACQAGAQQHHRRRRATAADGPPRSPAGCTVLPAVSPPCMAGVPFMNIAWSTAAMESVRMCAGTSASHCGFPDGG